MLKLGAISLVGLVVYGWFALEIGQILGSDPPPTISADKGPIRHRPEGYVAARGLDRAMWFVGQQGPQDTTAIDVNLILNR